MERMNRSQNAFFVVIILIAGLALACRTADTLAQLVPARPTAVPEVTDVVKRAPTARKHVAEKIPTTPTEIVAATEEPATPEPPTVEPPTDVPPPTDPPPTNRPPPPPKPAPTNPPPPTAVPPPQYPYRVLESRCGPNVVTFIEGYVYDHGTPQNGMLVRISQGPDGQPDPNPDYRTGTDPRAGYYFQDIDSHAPHGGLWYLWVINPATNQRVSEISIVKTDPKRVEDTDSNPGSCQSATVNFTNDAPVVDNNPDANPTAGPTPTSDTLNDSPNP